MIETVLLEIIYLLLFALVVETIIVFALITLVNTNVILNMIFFKTIIIMTCSNLREGKNYKNEKEKYFV